MRQLPATSVRLRRTGQESWTYSLSAHLSGVLVWTQAYDPLWKLSGIGGQGTPLPVQSLLDGYLVTPGHHAGSIAFANGSHTAEGVAITLASAIALLAIALAGWYLAGPADRPGTLP